MERDPSTRSVNAPLLPKQYYVAEYFHAVTREHRLVVNTEQNYQISTELRSALERRGSILKLAGVEHPSGSIEFIIPDGVTSLGAFLNSTSADQHRAWKRRYMFGRIQEFLDGFTSQGLALRTEEPATRHCIGQTDLSDPVLLPAQRIQIAQASVSDAQQRNTDFYKEIKQDIIEVAPPDERDFPF